MITRLGLCGAVVFVLGVAHQDEKVANVNDSLVALQSQDVVAQEKAQKQLAEGRKIIIEHLIALLDRDKTTVCGRLKADPGKYMAIMLLGEYRAEEGVDGILDNFFYGYGEVLSEIMPSPPPPSVKALTQIGLPATKNILQRLLVAEIEESVKYVTAAADAGKETWISQQKKWCVIRYYRRIFRDVYGDEWTVLVKAIIDKADKEKKDLLSKNLKQLLKE